ncbi:PH domain-containing protein [Streptomyces sp. NPDC048352]|uniref:PH domain-containing protein n=1 Tax=Streptomyces sp. NPDC048352 TaxID=3154718 RepID=UPI003435D715
MSALDAARTDAAAPEDDLDGAPWQRLDGRLIWVNLMRLLLSLAPTVLSVLFFGTGRRLSDLWPAMAATGVGVVISVGDVVRWLRTRYRITGELVEIRTGRIMRVYRQVPRDRIRAVDHKARLRHRLAGLRVVVISSGGARPALRLDAVSRESAQALRLELMRGVPDPEAEQTASFRETPIARVRWYWIFYNVINIWGMLVGALMLWSLDSMAELVGLDLTGAIGGVVDRLAPGRWGSYALWGAVVFLLGFLALATGFVQDNWHFTLVRRFKEDGSELITRQGLMSTREVHRDDRRLRGVQLSEPLFWRWIGLTETAVVSTGLASWSLTGEPASSILPRGPVREARRVAALVLPGPARPLEAPLRRHPRGALLRRLLWAVASCTGLSGLAAWLGATGAVPGWVWAVPLWALPLAAAGAVVAFRALGHAYAQPYLVMRHGLSRRQTSALRREAVLGLRIRQSVVQRWLGLVSVATPTAAGLRIYQAPDMSVEQFVTLAGEAVPELLAEFLEGGARENRPAPASNAR